MNKTIRTPATAILLIISIISTLVFGRFLGYSRLGLISVIGIVVDIALCVVLFKKKRDNMLVIVLGCSALLDFILLISTFTLVTLLSFAVDVLLVVYALALCEQTLVKADFSKIKELASKFYYLPAAISLVLLVISTYAGIIEFREIYRYSRYWSLIRYFTHLPFVVPVIQKLLYIAIILTLSMWLKDPYAQLETSAATEEKEEYVEAYCSLGKHIVLCLFTFGIWYLIWIYRTTKYLNNAPNSLQYNPTNKLLLCMFVPFYQIYWFYKHGQRIDGFSKQKNLNNADMATLCLILGIFIPIVACILMQDRINTICTSKETANNPGTADTVAMDLKKYKELLDSGIITQEEFDTKKKQILGL